MYFIHSLVSIVAMFVLVLAQAGSSPGVTDKQVTVGGFLGLSGDFALAARDVEQATEAYFNKINDAGGVNGRKLKFIAIDDGYVPSRSAAAARRLVEQDDVFVIMPAFGTPNALAAMPYVQSKDVPMFGVQGYSRNLFPAQKDVYGNWAPFADQIHLMADYFFKHGPVKQIGFIGLDNEAGAAGLVGAEDAAKAHGQTLVSVAVPPGAPDYRSAILDLRGKGVSHLLMVLGPQDTAKVVTEAREAGWNPQFGGHQGTPDTLTIQLGGKAIEGVYGIATSALPTWDTPVWPGVKDYLHTLARYFPEAKASAFGIRAYADAMVFVETLKRSGATPTRPAFVRALEDIKGFKTGIYPPVTYGPDRHDGNVGGIVVQDRGGVWLPVNN